MNLIGCVVLSACSSLLFPLTCNAQTATEPSVHHPAAVGPADVESAEANESEPDPRDNEVTVDIKTVAGSRDILPATQPTDSALVLQFGSDRFAGTMLSRPDFSPDGKELVVSDGAETRIFDVSSGRTTARLPSARATLFVAGDRFIQQEYQDVRLINRAGEVLQTIKAQLPEKIAVSQDGQRLVIATAWDRNRMQPQGRQVEPTVTLWNLQTGEKVADLGTVYHKTGVVRDQAGAFWQLICGTSVGFDSSQTLMTIAADGHVKLWDAATGKAKPCADIVIDPAISATLAPDGKAVVLADAAPRRIDVTTGVATPLPFVIDPIANAATTRKTAVRRPLTRSPIRNNFGQFHFLDGGKIISCLYRGAFHRWDIQSGQELPAIERTPAGFEAVASADNKNVAVTVFDQLELIDGATAKSKFAHSAPEGTVLSLNVTGDGKRLIVGDDSKSLYGFDADSGRLLAWRRRGPKTTNSLLPVYAIGRTQSRNVIWSLGYQLAITRDADTLAPIGEPIGLSVQPPFTVSRDGSTVAGSVGRGYEFQPLKPPATQPLAIPTVGSEIRISPVLALSPDCQRLAIADPYLLTILRSDPGAPDAIMQQYFFTTGSRSGEQPADAKAIELDNVFACDLMQYTRDGKTLLGISRDGAIAFDAEHLTPRWVLTDPASGPTARPMCVSDDTRLMAYRNEQGVSIIDNDDGRSVATLHLDAKYLRLLQFVPGTTRLVMVMNGRQFQIWDWRVAVENEAAASAATDDTVSDAIESDQPARAYAALFALMHHPADLLQLAKNLETKEAKKPIETWIDGLSSTDPAERERSHHQLERAGAPAAAAIRHALATAKPGEALDRLQALSDLLGDEDTGSASATGSSISTHLRRASRIIEAIDWLHTDQSQESLRQLANSGDADIRDLAAIALSHTPRP